MFSQYNACVHVSFSYSWLAHWPYFTTLGQSVSKRCIRVKVVGSG